MVESEGRLTPTHRPQWPLCSLLFSQSVVEIHLTVDGAGDAVQSAEGLCRVTQVGQLEVKTHSGGRVDVLGPGGERESKVSVSPPTCPLTCPSEGEDPHCLA